MTTDAELFGLMDLELENDTSQPSDDELFAEMDLELGAVGGQEQLPDAFKAYNIKQEKAATEQPALEPRGPTEFFQRGEGFVEERVPVSTTNLKDLVLNAKTPFDQAKALSNVSAEQAELVMKELPLEQQREVSAKLLKIKQSAPKFGEAVRTAGALTKFGGKVVFPVKDPYTPDEIAGQGFVTITKEGEVPKSAKEMKAIADKYRDKDGKIPLFPKIKDSQYDPKKLSNFLQSVKRWEENPERQQRVKEVGEKLIVDANEIFDPLDYKAYEIGKRIENLKNTQSPYWAALERGDLGFVLDQATSDAFFSGNKEEIESFLKLKEKFKKDSARPEEERKGLHKNTYISLLEMLWPMGKTAPKTAVPVVGGLWAGYEWGRQGMGEVAGELYKAGVPLEEAAKIGAVTGVLYAAVEQLQVKQLTNIPKAGIKKGVRSYAMKMLKEKGKDWVQEVTEEGIQKLITDIGIEYGKKKSGVSDKTVIETIKETATNTAKEMGHASLPMAILSLAGLGAGIAQAGVEGEFKAEPPADVEGITEPTAPKPTPAIEPEIKTEEEVDIEEPAPVEPTVEEEVLSPEEIQEIETGLEPEEIAEPKPVAEKRKIKRRTLENVVEEEIGEWVKEGLVTKEEASDPKIIKMAESAADKTARNEVTGLPSKAHKHSAIDQIYKEKGADEEVITISMDQDYFKPFNDSFDHATGDDVLVQSMVPVNQLFESIGLKHFHESGDENFAIGRFKKSEMDDFVKKLDQVKEAMENTEIILPNGKSVPMSMTLALSNDPAKSDNLLSNVKENLGRNSLGVDKDLQKQYNIKERQGPDVKQKYVEAGLTGRGLDSEQKQTEIKEVPKLQADVPVQRQRGAEPGRPVERGLPEPAKAERAEVTAKAEKPAKKPTKKPIEAVKKTQEIRRDLLAEYEAVQKSKATKTEKLNSEYEKIKLGSDLRRRLAKKIKGDQWLHLIGQKNKDNQGNLITRNEATEKELQKVVDGWNSQEFRGRDDWHTDDVKDVITEGLNMKAFVKYHQDYKAKLKGAEAEAKAGEAAVAKKAEAEAKREEKQVAFDFGANKNKATFKDKVPNDIKKQISPEVWEKTEVVFDKPSGDLKSLKKDERGSIEETKDGKFKVTLNPNLKPNEVAEVLFHELGGHAGAANVLKTNKKLHKRISDIYKTQQNKELVKQIKKAYKGESDDIIFSEWIAKSVEDHLATPKKRGVAYQAWKAIKEFFINLGIPVDSVDDAINALVKETKKLDKVEPGLIVKPMKAKKISEEPGDLFAGTKFEKDEKKTRKALEKAEVRLRQEDRKGGAPDVTGLPMFEGKEIEGTEQMRLFSKKLPIDIDKEGNLTIKDIDAIPKSIWTKVNRIMKRKGFDYRGADDAKELFGRDPDWLSEGQQEGLKEAYGLQDKKGFKKTDEATIKELKKRLGTTTDAAEAGWILDDGKILDLSGKKEGGTPGKRALDHREVGDIYKFMEEGNIRVNGYSGIEIKQPPSEKQINSLKKYINQLPDEFYMDIGGDSIEYPSGTKPSKVISDIKDYFAGKDIKPTSEVQQFRQMFSKKIEDAKPKTETKAFKDWFGESKVVDEDGKPKVVYHGTPKKFDEFSYRFMGEHGTAEGFGFYFTDKKSIAEGYSEKEGELIPAYISIEKPLSTDKVTITEKDFKKFIKKLDPDGWGYLSNWGDVSYSGYENVLEEAAEAELGSVDNDVELIGSLINSTGGLDEEFADALKTSIGYDGVIEKEAEWGGKQTIYVPMKPTQIKHATGNLGTFDPKDPSILKSKKLTKETADLEHVEKLNKETRSLQAKIRFISPELALERANMALKIKELKEESADQVRSLVYDYAKKIGLKGEPYNRVDTLIKNAKTAKNYQKAVEIMDDVLQRREKNVLRRKVRDTLKKEKDRLKRLTGKGKSNQDITANKRLGEYIQDLEDVSPRRLEKMEETVKYFQDNPDKEIPESVKRDVLLATKTNIRDMDSRQLIRVIQDISHIKKQGKLKSELKKAQRDRYLERYAGSTAKVVRETTKKGAAGTLKQAADKGKRRKLEAFFNLAKKYGWSHIRPERILDWFTNFKQSGLQSQVFDKALKAEETQLKNTENTFKAFKEINKDINMAETLRKPYMKVESEGESINLSLDQMMFIYANSQNPGNRAHLQGTGIDDGMIAEVESELPQKYKNVVDETIEYYDTEQYQRMNEVFQREHNVDMPQQHKYFPIMNLKTDRAETTVMNDLIARHSAKQGAVQKGMTKSRVKSKSPYGSLSFYGTVVNNLQQSEHYIAYNDAIREMNEFLNNKELRTAMEGKSEEATAQIKDWVKAIAYGKVRGSEQAIDKVSDWLRTNYMTSVLGLNLVTIMKQPASFAQGLKNVSKPGAVASAAKFIQNPYKMVEFVNEKSVMMRNRGTSYERELAEIAEKDMLKKQLNAQTVFGKAKELSMMGITAADKATTTVLWYTKYNDVLNKTGNEDIAIKEADRVIRRTQPMGGIVHLPQIYRGGGLARAYTMFTNQLNQNLNLMFELQQTWGEKKNIDKAAEIAYYAIIPSMLIYMASHGGRLPTEDPEGWARAFVGNLTGGLMLGNKLIDSAMLYAGGKVKEARGGFGDTKGSVSYATNFAPTSFGALEDIGLGVGYGKPEKAIDATMKLSGTPYTSIKRGWKGAKLAIEKKDPRYFIWSKTALKNPSIKKQMVKKLGKPSLTFKEKQRVYEYLSRQNDLTEIYNEIPDLNKKVEKIRNSLFKISVKEYNKKFQDKPKEADKFEKWKLSVGRI